MPQHPDPTPATTDPGALTASERDLIRREFCVRFAQAPRVADGIYLRTWRGGPQAGQPKIPKLVQGLIERGLMRIGPEVVMGGRRATFTPAGLDALRRMMQDRRALDPGRFAHVHQELGEGGKNKSRQT